VICIKQVCDFFDAEQSKKGEYKWRALAACKFCQEKSD
jgi:hypothetical protein